MSMLTRLLGIQPKPDVQGEGVEGKVVFQWIHPDRIVLQGTIGLRAETISDFARKTLVENPGRDIQMMTLFLDDHPIMIWKKISDAWRSATVKHGRFTSVDLS